MASDLRVFGVILGFAVCWSLAAGLDDNWDLHNYHLYDAYAYLDGRERLDIEPAGFQVFLNPLLDVPYYLVAVRWFSWAPALVCVLAALPYTALAWFTYRAALASGFCQQRESAALAALCGLTAGDLLCGIGLTFGDIPAAALIVAAVWGAMLVCQAPPGRAAARTALLAGMAAGAAAALKLTAAMFVPALVLGLAAALGLTRRLLLAVFYSGFGFLAAFASLYGPWGLSLWSRYRNPFFPFFNGIFHSPWLAQDFSKDTRYFPHTALQALLYPFYWLHGKAHVVSETGVGDWRLAIAYVCVVGYGAAWVWVGRHAEGDPRRRFFAVFFAAAFVLWEAEFSVLRYAAALEALSGLMVAAAVHSVRPRDMAPILGCTLVFLITTTSLSGWGRISLRQAGFHGPVFTVASPSLPDGSLVVLPDHPSAFVAPFLDGRALRFVSLDEPPDTPLGAAVRSAIVQAAQISVIHLDIAGRTQERLARYGLILDREHCAPIETNRPRWGRLTLCAAHRQ